MKKKDYWGSPLSYSFPDLPLGQIWFLHLGFPISSIKDIKLYTFILNKFIIIFFKNAKHIEKVRYVRYALCAQFFFGLKYIERLQHTSVTREGDIYFVKIATHCGTPEH